MSRVSPRPSRAPLALLLALASLPVTTARADERPQRLAWPENTREAGWGEVVTAGALGAGVLALHFLGSTETPAWTRVNRFDAALRSGFRVSDERLDGVRTASDVLLFTMAAYPILVDDLGLVLVGDRNPELLAEMAAVDAQSYALMGILVGIVKVSSARQRPYAYGAGCAEQPSAPDCGDEDRNRSFFSGHAALSFTGAGLVCFHQRQIEGLYGSRAAGLGVCGSAMALATTTALLRVLGDKHWGTDVLAGTGIGLFSGFVLPYLLHGRALVEVRGEHARGALLPLVDRGTVGLELTGSFAGD